MSFLREDEEVVIKTNKIWKKITKNMVLNQTVRQFMTLNCTKTKLKTYDDKVNTVFTDNEIPKEKIHYSCIAAISVDCMLKLDGENYPQVYLEQCKYRLKKKNIVYFIDNELEESSDEESEFKKSRDKESEL